jgi:putative DNA primase/helicase
MRWDLRSYLVSGLLEPYRGSLPPPYGRHVIEVPRQCVFAGTTNPSTYLADEENRRFWPVRCGPMIDTEGVRRDRDQLWAESVVRFEQGSKWWFDADDGDLLNIVRTEQAARREMDPWTQPILDWLESREDAVTTIETILAEVLGKNSGAWSQHDKKRVGAILRHGGWTHFQKRIGRRKAECWRKRPES